MTEPVSVEAVLQRHVGLMKKFAHQYTTDFWSVEDLEQESRIALWREMVKRPGDNLDKLASYVIKRRVLDLTYGNKLPFAHREAGEKTFSPKDPASLDGLAEYVTGGAGADEWLSEMTGTEPSPEDVYVRAETATEVRSAIAGLDSRGRVVAEGKLDERTDAETAEVLGLTKARVSQLWRREVAPALRESLAA